MSKRRKKRHCEACGEEVRGRRKYCNAECRAKGKAEPRRTFSEIHAATGESLKGPTTDALREMLASPEVQTEQPGPTESEDEQRQRFLRERRRRIAMLLMGDV